MSHFARALPFLGLIACAPAAAPAPQKHRSCGRDNAEAIVQAGAPVLRVRAANVEPSRIATPEFQNLIAEMIKAMRKAPGVGLAAPQIGIPLRVIVLEDPAELASRLTDEERHERERVPFSVRVFINPVLHPVGDDHATFFEGCLSVNGYVGLVKRSREVEVNGLDEHGASQTWRVRGWPARILQHEVDHIDGTLYIDRMLTRSFTTAEFAKSFYAGKPIGEIRKMLGL